MKTIEIYLLHLLLIWLRTTISATFLCEDNKIYEK